MAGSSVTTVRLDPRTRERLDKMAERLKVERSAVIRQAVDRGAQEILLDDAIARYQRREFSSGAAAEAAGVSLIRFLHELRARGLSFLTDTEGMIQELREFKEERRERGARRG